MRKKIFTITIYEHEDINGNKYNEVVTWPNLKGKQWDFLGHHFFDKADAIVKYVKSLKTKIAK
jgi:hypothetical protein